jgi:putative acetyltransferase
MHSGFAPAPHHADLTIRTVRSGDFQRLTGFLNAQRGAVAPAPRGVIGPRVPDWLRKRIEGDDPHTFRLIALLADEVIGEAALTFGFAPRPATGRLTITVREDQRRRGLGTNLLGKLIQAAETPLALRCIELNVLGDNNAALRLYRKMGFETEARRQAGAAEILLMKRAIKNRQKPAHHLAGF